MTHLPRLHPKQKEILKGLERFNVLVMGRRIGKTYFGIYFSIIGAVTHSLRGAWYSPTYKDMLEADRDWETLQPL